MISLAAGARSYLPSAGSPFDAPEGELASLQSNPPEISQLYTSVA